MEDPSGSVGTEPCSGFLLDKPMFLNLFYCLSTSVVSSEGRRGQFFHTADVSCESQCFWEGAVTGTSHLSEYLLPSPHVLRYFTACVPMFGYEHSSECSAAASGGGGQEELPP